MTAGVRERKGKSVAGVDASVPYSGPLLWLVAHPTDAAGVG